MITKKEYDALRPYEQGYTSGKFSDDMDPMIAEGPGYSQDSAEMRQWLYGYRAAIEQKVSDAIMEGLKDKSHQ